MLPAYPYHIFPLGDSALTIEFGQKIDESINKEVIARFDQFKIKPINGMTELVPAYSSLTIYYDIGQLAAIAGKNKETVFETVKREVEQRLLEPVRSTDKTNNLIRVPVCYHAGYGPDLSFISQANNISIDKIVEMHTANPYQVYMLGFLPGFAYMGIVDERISAARKATPQTVAQGSVGIAGRQTGIYPFQSPGGWQIIGRTPLIMFDIKKDQPARLHPGDHVQFYSITKEEFLDTDWTNS